MNTHKIYSKAQAFWQKKPVRIIVGLCLLILLYFEISSKGAFSDIGVQLYRRMSLLNTTNILVILFLVFMNFFFEALKWKISLSNIYRINLKMALKSILVGFSWGIFTPHRIGDYGGRLFCLSSGNRVQAGIINFMNGLSQNANNFIFGVIGLFCIMQEVFPYISSSNIMLIVFLILVILWLYFNFERAIKLVLHFIPFKDIKQKVGSVIKIEMSIMLKLSLLFLSFLRYVCYIFLYIYLLFIFGSEESIQNMILYVAVIFLIQSGLPLPPLLGAIARVEIAIIMLSMLNIEIDVIVLSSLGLWILNIGLPALFGITIMSFSKGTKIPTY